MTDAWTVIVLIRSPPLSSHAAGALQRGPDGPGGEFFFADPAELAFGLLPGRDGEDLVEDLLADDLDGDAREDDAGVDVHVVVHVLKKGRVGGDLDRRRRLAAEDAAAAGGEDADVGAAGDD